METLPVNAKVGVREYTTDVLAYKLVLGIGFLILLYAAFNPDVFSGEAINYTLGSLLIFIGYPALNIFKLSGKKIIVGSDYIAWNDRAGEDGIVKFADVTRIIYSIDQMGCTSVNLHCFETSASLGIDFQNFSKNDESEVRGAILTRCPQDIVVAHLKIYKSISSTVSYEFTGSDSMDPDVREAIKAQLKSLESASLSEGLVAFEQIESEIALSRKGEASELYMPRKFRQLE